MSIWPGNVVLRPSPGVAWSGGDGIAWWPYGAEFGRGTCAEISPLTTSAALQITQAFIILMAWVKVPFGFAPTTDHCCWGQSSRNLPEPSALLKKSSAELLFGHRRELPRQRVRETSVTTRASVPAASRLTVSSVAQRRRPATTTEIPPATEASANAPNTLPP